MVEKMTIVRERKGYGPIRPVYLMYTPDITKEEKNLAIETLEEILDIAEVGKQMRIFNLGVWRMKEYRDSKGKLIPYRSVDWYVDDCFDPERRQVCANRSLIRVAHDLVDAKLPHYDVILTAKDLYTKNVNFIVGLAEEGIGTIISVNRFRGILGRRIQSEAKKQELYHEVGHVFGLPNEKRGYALTRSLGTHCTNKCSLRQGLSVPKDWILFAYDRMKTGKIYCDACVRDLRNYFSSR